MSDRKYRHQGYQDSGGYSSNTNRTPRPQTPYEPQNQRLEGAPRGRTAGGFGPEVFKCNSCGTQRLGLDQPTSEETCVKCAADLHTCGNCRSFDTTTLWECRESIPARIVQACYILTTTDCYPPLRTMLAAVVIASLILLIGDKVYARRSLTGRERRPRLFLALAIAMIFMAMGYGATLEESCVRQPMCGVTGDLNCSATNRQVFRMSIPVGCVAIGGLLTGEIVRRRRLTS